jgi:hypothetical protein
MATTRARTPPLALLLLLLLLARPAQLKRRRGGPRPPAHPPSYTFEDERRETRPRLALCIVGLFRDHRERVLPSLRARLFNSTEWRTDVFIEAWSTLGANRIARLRSGTDQTGGPLDPQWLAEYPNLVSLKVERTPHNVSRHFHGLDLPAALVHANANSYGSTLPNLRRMHQCHQAVRAWEDACGFRYDAVVKMRPDYVCGGSSWAALLVAVRQVLAHGRDPRAQPYPFFHEHGWPAVMVSDKFAVGTSAAMGYYLGAWRRLRRLFADPRLRDASGRANHLVGEKLMKVHMRAAPFDHMQTFCCISPRQRRKKGRCALDLKPRTRSVNKMAMASLRRCNFLRAGRSLSKISDAYTSWVKRSEKRLADNREKLVADFNDHSARFKEIGQTIRKEGMETGFPTELIPHAGHFEDRGPRSDRGGDRPVFEGAAQPVGALQRPRHPPRRELLRALPRVCEQDCGADHRGRRRRQRRAAGGRAVAGRQRPADVAGEADALALDPLRHPARQAQALCVPLWRLARRAQGTQSPQPLCRVRVRCRSDRDDRVAHGGPSQNGGRRGGPGPRPFAARSGTSRAG